MAANSNRRKTIIRGVEGGQLHTSPIPQGVRAGGFIFLSALRGVTPGTAGVDEENAEKQARQLFANLESTLAGIGATLDDVVKVAVYMRDLQRDRPVFNKVWGEYFGDSPPARHAVQVGDIGDAQGKTLYMIDVTALDPEA
jgi:2-iminobutanoate/2-iminopropanoate deaminase